MMNAHRHTLMSARKKNGMYTILLETIKALLYMSMQQWKSEHGAGDRVIVQSVVFAGICLSQWSPAPDI